MRADEVLWEVLSPACPWESYEGAMDAVVKNSQMAERMFRVGDELVRVTVTVAPVPPYRRADADQP